jgi:hypothetical protein
MMNKRITISILTLLFLVSTTGMPIWSHYCEMMGKRSISECEMCKAEIEKLEPACCSEEVQNNKLRISSDNSTCCIDQFDYKKIDDNFFQTNITTQILSTVSIVEINLSSIDSPEGKQYTQQYNYDLPPPKFGKQLLQIIHQLKLDLPVC